MYKTEADAKMLLFIGGGIGNVYSAPEIARIRGRCQGLAKMIIGSGGGLIYVRGVEILKAWGHWRAEVDAEEARTGIAEVHRALAQASDEGEHLAEQMTRCRPRRSKASWRKRRRCRNTFHRPRAYPTIFERICSSMGSTRNRWRLAWRGTSLRWLRARRRGHERHREKDDARGPRDPLAGATLAGPHAAPDCAAAALAPQNAAAVGGGHMMTTGGGLRAAFLFVAV